MNKFNLIALVVLVAVCSAAELDDDASRNRPYHRPVPSRPVYEEAEERYEVPRYPAKRPPTYHPEPREDYARSYQPIRPVKEPYGYGDYYCPKVYDLESTCRPAKDCAVWFDLVSVTPGTLCKLHDGSPGMCCPDLPYNGEKGHDLLRSLKWLTFTFFGLGRGGAFKQAKKEVKVYRDIDTYSLNAAAKAGRFNQRLMEETEKEMRANNVTVRVSSAQYTHLLFFRTKEATLNISRGAFICVETTKELGNRFELNADEAGFGLSQFSLKGTILGDSCPAEPVCDREMINSPYRTLDGSCNNLVRTAWGKSNTQFQRALVAAYADGVWAPRVASNGKALPSARLVSISVVPDIDAPSEVDTLWVMQYGQFVDHDITSTPVFRMSKTCCHLVVNQTN